MTKKEKYRELCEYEKTIPIFSKDWWMDAVCGENNWDVLLVEKGRQIVASLPYYLRKRGKRREITQPPLTQTNGIWIKYPPNQKYCKKLAYEKEVMTGIISQLDELNLGYYNQNFHYSITNWLPFYWKGFKQTTRYTYVIEDLENSNEVYKNFKCNIRNKIKKANKRNVKIISKDDIETFYMINKKTFDRQNIAISYSLKFIEKLDNTLKEKKARKIFFAIDENKKVHSVLYLIWDLTSSYVHMVGEDPELRNSGAGILLIWESIKYTKEILNLNKYDFEGSMIESVEEVRRSCGAIQKPYFNIKKNYRKENIFKIIVRDIYHNYPILQKAYHKIKGR